MYGTLLLENITSTVSNLWIYFFFMISWKISLSTNLFGMRYASNAFRLKRSGRHSSQVLRQFKGSQCANK